MGEMADLCLDQMFDPEFDQTDDDPDALQRDDCIWFPKRSLCRKCRKGGLHWELVNNHWLLHDHNGIHMCKPAIDIDIDIANLAKGFK